MHIKNENGYSFVNKNKLNIKESDNKAKYYIRFKENIYINSSIIEKKENNQIITKEISRNEFNSIINDIEFYAKVL